MEVENHITDPFAVIVSGRSISVGDPTPTAREILEKAGFEPADDYALIEMATIGSHMVSLDERVTLRRGETARLFAFRTGEVFTFTVNEHGFQWGRDASLNLSSATSPACRAKMFLSSSAKAR